MNEKLDSLVRTETFTTVGRSTSMKTIPCKCVFTIKRDSLGNVSRYKARLVAQGFRQQHGIDYDQTFAPTLNISSVRLLLTIAVHLDYETAHLDVKTAFLNGVCREEIYMQPPEGTKSLKTGKAWKLNKCLYVSSKLLGNGTAASRNVFATSDSSKMPVTLVSTPKVPTLNTPSLDCLLTTYW